MYLKTIAVEASAKANLPHLMPFRWTAHHVKEIFLELLPAKFTLDGSSKIQVTCGPRGNEPQYRQMLGTSNYFCEGFDFPQYYSKLSAERDQMLLQTLEESLLGIASSVDGPAATRELILKASRDTTSNDFSQTLHSRKLSKTTPCGKLRINLFRNLNRQIGEVWSCEVVARDRTTIHKEWIGTTPHYLDLTDFYKSSSWTENTFAIQSSLRKTVYELDVSPFLQQM